MQKLFEKNISFFYKNIPEYYKLITNIKTRNYKIVNDNIINIHTNEKLYPNTITADSISLSKIPTHNSLWEKKFFSLSPNIWNEKEFPHTGKCINNLIKTAQNCPSYNKEGFYFDKQFLPATAIFGLLGGKHLDLLVKNYEFQSLFVYEPNPEFFALSLYFVDYPYIYNKLNDRFFLWINGTLDYFAIEKFFYERIVSSSFLTLSLTTYSHPLIEDAKNKFEEIRISKFRGWGTFEDELKGIKNHINNIGKYPLLNRKKDLNIPVCVVANGKSLEKSLGFIKKNQNSMIIVSVGTAIKPLLKAGIQSDFHIEQERIDILPEILKDILPEYKGFFVGASVVNPKVFKYAKKPLMYIREGFTMSNAKPLTGSSPIVGNSGFAFAASFTKEIYLCGMDLGFRLNENRHPKNSFYDNKDDKAKTGIKIKGNFSNDIYTDSLLLSSKRKIELLIEALNLNVYNLSDGVYIKNTVPLEDKTLPPLNKKPIISEIVKCFKKTDSSDKRINLKPLLENIDRSLLHKMNSNKEITGFIDFIEDIFKQGSSYDFKILKGSIYHFLISLYIIAHKLNSEDFNSLMKNITVSEYFPKKI